MTTFNAAFPSRNEAAEICGDELTPAIRCQSPKWRCLVQDHGWSDGRRTITWKSLAATKEIHDAPSA
jgi:hypothetical protein